MLNALDLHNEIILATPISKALCPFCRGEVISKCGEINIWHWAHKNKKECDSWSEGETEWHLNWKNRFKPQEREVTLEKHGLKHRADIYLSPFENHPERKVVIEIQKSPISSEEIFERECFYGSMCWIFDGSDFSERFEIYKTKKEYPKNYEFVWKHPRKSILSCKLPSYIDFGGNTLFRIVTSNYDGEGYGYFIDKKDKEKLYNEMRKVYYSCESFWKEKELLLRKNFSFKIEKEIINKIKEIKECEIKIIYYEKEREKLTEDEKDKLWYRYSDISSSYGLDFFKLRKEYKNLKNMLREYNRAKKYLKYFKYNNVEIFNEMKKMEGQKIEYNREEDIYIETFNVVFENILKENEYEEDTRLLDWEFIFNITHGRTKKLIENQFNY